MSLNLSAARILYWVQLGVGWPFVSAGRDAGGWPGTHSTRLHRTARPASLLGARITGDWRGLRDGRCAEMTQSGPTAAEMLDQSPDAVVLVDAAGTIVYANQRVSALFGTTPEALRARPVESLIPERMWTVHTAHRTAYQQHPQVRAMGDGRLPLFGRRVDGTEFPVDIYLVPIWRDGQRWILAVIRDATERDRSLDELRAAKELAEQVARTKGEFLTLAAHDLSQPVQTLELTIAAIERAVAPETELAELTAQASAALARMRELTKMLMQIAQLESGSMPILEEPVGVTEIFADLERQFAATAQAKAVRLSSDPCTHIVETDPALLRGLLSNLLSNAIRYTAQGEVKVRCIVPGDGGLRLAVSDTGVGIPSDQMHRIFEDFYRIEPARRSHREGFGLGLGIVRRLATLLELSVTVESTVGRGSTFEVTIPPHRVHAA